MALPYCGFSQNGLDMRAYKPRTIAHLREGVKRKELEKSLDIGNTMKALPRYISKIIIAAISRQIEYLNAKYLPNKSAYLIIRHNVFSI
jgi:capsid portal protein